MTPEEKKLLEETHALARETNHMLKAMRRNGWIGLVFRILFWVVIIILPLYFLQPYLGSLPSAADFQNLVNQYKSLNK